LRAQLFISDALKIGAVELVPEGRKLKSGRISPYFFNSGKFDNAKAIRLLASAYAREVVEMGCTMPQVIFGPAYKGIPLAVATAIALLSDYDTNVSYAFNRKETKDHGEGGIVVRHSLKEQKVLIVDDVMTTGSSSGEAVEIVRANGGIPIGCIIAFDRQERGMTTNLSAVQEFEEKYGIPVRAAATLDDLILALKGQEDSEILGKILAYKKQYGV